MLRPLCPVVLFSLLLSACDASVDSSSGSVDAPAGVGADVVSASDDDATVDEVVVAADASNDVPLAQDATPPDEASDTAGVPLDDGMGGAPDGTVSDVVPCVPDCDGAVCGDDGCGGSCGACAGPLEVCAGGVCLCVPSCSGAACGDDGCGGVCGQCGVGATCDAGACVCIPTCGSAACGDDGCGGSCGACAEGAFCGGGQCVAFCTPDCQGKSCGDDGCGGSCGSCGDGLACQLGQCQCAPSCVGVACGSDGCGGSCGTCTGGLTCEVGACVCVPSCGAAVCGDDGCGGSCGACTSGQACEAGSCITQATCPPEGPYGTSVGTTVKDLTLMDCEGNPFSLHDLCAENAAYVYSYADWCPICKELASSTLQQRQDALGPSGLQTVLIVEDGSGGPATAFLCKQVRAKYKLTFPVLYDPTQSFKTHFAQGGPNEINLVLDQGGAITYLKRYASQVEVEAAIKAALE